MQEQGMLHQEEQSDLDCPACGAALEQVSGDNTDGEVYCSQCRLHFIVQGGMMRMEHRKVLLVSEAAVLHEFSY